MKIVAGYAALMFAAIVFLSYVLSNSARMKMPLFRFIIFFGFFVVGGLVLIRSDGGERMVRLQASTKSNEEIKQQNVAYSERFISLLRRVSSLDKEMENILQSTGNLKSLRDIYAIFARAVVFRRDADQTINQIKKDIDHDFNAESEKDVAHSVIDHISNQSAIMLEIIITLKESQEKDMPDNEFAKIMGSLISKYRSEQMAAQKDMLFLREMAK
jgi:hypothetical protein